MSAWGTERASASAVAIGCMTNWSETQMRRFIDRVRRIPGVRKAYRQLINGHEGGAVACKPALRGRRHGW